jgi:hypothetical protein
MQMLKLATRFDVMATNIQANATHEKVKSSLTAHLPFPARKQNPRDKSDPNATCLGSKHRKNKPCDERFPKRDG